MSPTPKNQSDSWAEYRRLVLAELERLDTAVNKLTQVSLDHEKDLIEDSNALKNDLLTKIQTHKDETVDKVRAMITDIRSELLKRQQREDSQLENCIGEIDKKLTKVQLEVQVLKGKAALLGFISGLVVAVVSIIAQVMWSR
jgi:hypothetical protein